MQKKKYYFDYTANTPVDPKVQETLRAFYAEHFGNSSGIHAFARDMKFRLDEARLFFAKEIGARSSEIIFTASATESNNTVLKGLARHYPEKKHLLISAVEHASVYKTAHVLQDFGLKVEVVPVDTQGRVDPDEIKKRLRPDTLLVSVMWVNNELGTIQPVHEIAKVCREREVLFHCDAVQGFAKMPLKVHEMHVDFLSAAGHKIYGPIGVGLLFIRDGLKVEPLLHGGGHENGLRSSTVNVPGIVAFQKAMEIYSLERQEEWQRILELRERILSYLKNNMDGIRINSPSDGIPHILNVSFEKVNGELLAISLDKQGIALSTGSACSTGKVIKSRILQAIGVPAKYQSGTIRISLGRFTTDDEVDYLLEQLEEAVKKVRKIS